jgi:transcriptional regulator with XRE-family HTH domain
LFSCQYNCLDFSEKWRVFVAEGATQFGSRLKELRAKAGLTLKELSSRAGLTPDAIVKLESGNRSPTWDTAIALAKALGVSCEAFTAEPTVRIPESKQGRPPKTAKAEPQEKPASRKPRKEKL